MAHYMIQACLSTETLESMVENPELYDGSWLQSVVDRLDGKVVGSWGCLGEFDAVVICDLPDNSSIVALSHAFRAMGPVTRCHITCLLDRDEQQAAHRKAGGR
ncbi:MAG: GYD domain-containing protein [Planctomycetota bacterium]